MPGNLVLIGFSGTGKSTVGRALATRLGWELVDTDELIVNRFGRSIASVFRDDGETVFRAAERDAVEKACGGSRRVISVGGGAVVDSKNRAILSSGNLVVRLEANPSTILNRLRSSPNAEERPMIAGDNPLARITGLLASRAEAYAIADIAVTTEDRTVDSVVEDIAVAARQRISADVKA